MCHVMRHRENIICFANVGIFDLYQFSLSVMLRVCHHGFSTFCIAVFRFNLIHMKIGKIKWSFVAICSAAFSKLAKRLPLTIPHPSQPQPSNRHNEYTVFAGVGVVANGCENHLKTYLFHFGGIKFCLNRI